MKIIGAGLGRTGTLSLKLALEHIGLGPCYHMSEMLSQARSHAPLWIESAKGNPQWDRIFAHYQSTTDYPGCTFWREFLRKYPDARVILTTRDPDKWFESGAATVFSVSHRKRFEGDSMMAAFFRLVLGELEDRLGDRTRMIEYFNAWNRGVIAEVPADRLLVYHAGDGWEPLCAFLDVPVPAEPYPRVNTRDEMAERTGQPDAGFPPPAILEAAARDYLDKLRQKAFPRAP